MSDLDDLFAKDPLDLSDADINSIVNAFRAQRAAWMTEETTAKSAGGRGKPKRTKEESAQISLDDLDIQL